MQTILKICQRTEERDSELAQKRRSGAASRLWETAAAQIDRIAGRGNPVKDGVKVGSKRRRRNRTMGTAELHSTVGGRPGF